MLFKNFCRHFGTIIRVQYLFWQIAPSPVRTVCHLWLFWYHPVRVFQCGQQASWTDTKSTWRSESTGRYWLADGFRNHQQTCKVTQIRPYATHGIRAFLLSESNFSAIYYSCESMPGTDDTIMVDRIGQSTFGWNIRSIQTWQKGGNHEHSWRSHRKIHCRNGCDAGTGRTVQNSIGTA